MYNPSLYANVFMEVLSMNETLKTQLKILKLSDIKPNFSELARFYDLDRRTVKKYYDGYEGKAAHRNKLKTQLKILKLSDIKPNFSELARFYDLDRRTVKKYYDGYEGKAAHRNKPSKLDKHYDLIKQKLSIKGANVRAVYEFILSEKDPDIGTYSNFNKYIKSKGLKPVKTVPGHPRFETAPGVQAQVDWKEDVVIANKFGEIFTFQVFDYKLGNSRYTHFTYKLYKTRQDVFDCLIASFKATGGVPREILFDNMSSIVDRDGERKNVSNQVRAFAKDFNFKIKLCKPRHPFTKGKVEAVNKFLAWLLPYEGEFETEDELIAILEKINQKVNTYPCQEITKGKVEAVNKFLAWLLPYEGEFETEDELIAILEKINQKVNTYPCQETNMPPLILFQKEKEYLQPLPTDDVVESYLPHDRQTTVRSDSLVTYHNCKYSVPPEYIGKPVRLLVFENTLHIYFSTDLIAVHVLSSKRLNYQKEHYQQLLTQTMKDADAVSDLAEANLKQMDAFL